MGKKKSQVISIRLNPNIVEERDALQVLERKAKDNDIGYRQVITDALNLSSGYSPSMYGTEHVTPNMMHDLMASYEKSMAGYMENLLAEFGEYLLGEILKKIAAGDIDPHSSRPIKSIEAETDEEYREQQSDYMKNIAGDIMNRMK